MGEPLQVGQRVKLPFDGAGDLQATGEVVQLRSLGSETRVVIKRDDGIVVHYAHDAVELVDKAASSRE